MSVFNSFLFMLLCAFWVLAWADDASPVAGYMAYHQTLIKASRLSDIDAYLTKRMVASRGKVRESIALKGENPEAVEQKMFKLTQKYARQFDIKSVTESTRWPRGKSSVGNVIAIIVVDGSNLETRQPMHQELAMELEDGAWKYAGIWGGQVERLPAADLKPDRTIEITPLPPAGNVERAVR